MNRTLFKNIQSGIWALCICMLVLSACKKKNTDDATPSDATITSENGEQKVHTSDESALQAETEDVFSSVDSVMSLLSNRFGTGRMGVPGLCGGIIDSSSTGRNCRIRFNNGMCKGKIRSGEISIALTSGTAWRDAGSVLTITYTNYTVRRSVDDTDRTWTMNGTHIIKNINGGLLGKIWTQTVGTQIIHSIRGNMVLTFDNENQKRTWQIFKRKTYTKVSNVLYSLKLEGDTSIAEVAGICAIGTNRYGKEFSTQISEPIVFTNTCYWWRPVSGVKVHKKLKKEITVTFGTGPGGNAWPTGTCPEFYKVVWTGSDGKFKEFVLRY